jgi:hypothetical protein
VYNVIYKIVVLHGQLQNFQTPHIFGEIHGSPFLYAIDHKEYDYNELAKIERIHVVNSEIINIPRTISKYIYSIDIHGYTNNLSIHFLLLELLFLPFTQEIIYIIYIYTN